MSSSSDYALQPTFVASDARKPNLEHNSSLPNAMSWEPSPIPHSESLEEYRFGTIVASPERAQIYDELQATASESSSRESSVEGSADGGWVSPSSSSTGPSCLQSGKTSSSCSSSTGSTSPIAPAGSSPPNVMGRRLGLFRMPVGAQDAPIPPSLIRRGSLPSTTSMLAPRSKGSTHGSSPLIRASSDHEGRSPPSPETTDVDMASPAEPARSSRFLRNPTDLATVGASVPARLSSPIGRPPAPLRRDSQGGWMSSPFATGGAPTSAPSSYLFPAQGHDFPSANNQPMTPDTPTVILSGPSPIKRATSRVDLSLPPPGLPHPSIRQGFPFPVQPVEATPPTTPWAATSPLLTLPSSKALPKPPSAPTSSTGPLSPHLLDDHVLNPFFNARYELCSSLGSGGYGFVCIALDRFDQREVAVKFILKAKVPSHSWVEWGGHGREGDGMPAKGGKVPMECELLIRLKHWGIVAGLACFADHKFFYLVQELHGSSWGPSTPGTPIGTPSVSAYVPELTEGVPLPSPYAPSFALPPSPSVASPPMPPAQRPSINMERRGSCDLFECVELHKRFSENRARMIFTQIIETVYYLAAHKIYHRDIKDENIVVDRDFRVKLIDFGSAVWERGPEPTVYKDFYGTTAYASAEILAGGTYQASHAEVWSLGILLNILITGESPFSSPANAQAGRRSPLRAGVTMSAEVTDLIKRCLDVNPATRLSIAGIRGHRWLGLSTHRS